MKFLQYKENKSRGTFDFPLEYYHVRPGHPRYEMSYHWHTEYEIIRILRGSFTFNIEGEDLELKEGDILFIRDGILHGGTPQDCVYECIVFDLRLLHRENLTVLKYIHDIAEHQIYVYLHFPNPNSSYQRPDLKNIRAYQEIHQTVWYLFGAMERKAPGYELMVVGSLYQFFGTIIEWKLYSVDESAKNLKNHERIQQLKQALSIIESRYAEPLTLDDLAKSAGLSPKYFCRFFHEMTHRTPIDYLNYYRIECACIKLVTTQTSITDVALSCGFNDISYFIHTFNRYKGTTPKKYLKAPF